jgi:hypothetical protein
MKSNVVAPNLIWNLKQLAIVLIIMLPLYLSKSTDGDIFDPVYCGDDYNIFLNKVLIFALYPFIFFLIASFSIKNYLTIVFTPISTWVFLRFFWVILLIIFGGFLALWLFKFFFFLFLFSASSLNIFHMDIINFCPIQTLYLNYLWLIFVLLISIVRYSAEANRTMSAVFFILKRSFLYYDDNNIESEFVKSFGLMDEFANEGARIKKDFNDK